MKNSKSYTKQAMDMMAKAGGLKGYMKGGDVTEPLRKAQMGVEPIYGKRDSVRYDNSRITPPNGGVIGSGPTRPKPKAIKRSKAIKRAVKDMKNYTKKNKGTSSDGVMGLHTINK